MASFQAFKRWCVKRNRRIAAFIALAVFGVLLALVIFNIKQDDNNHRSSSLLSVPKLFPFSFFVSSSTLNAYCKKQGCTVLCSNFDENNINTLVDSINEVALQGCTSAAELRLQSVYFPDGEINKGWLKGCKGKFQKLIIATSNVEILGSEIFVENSLSTLNYLSLQDTQIKYLEQKSLFGISLETFELTFNSFRPILLEKNVFEGPSTTLTTVQFLNCLSYASLHNFTGGSTMQLSTLASLDLRQNNLGDIDNDAFTSVPNVKSLLMQMSGITSIGRNSFGSLRKLAHLMISDNELTTLPNGSFDFAKENTLIHIEGNSWKCDCNLEWLKSFYSENNYLFYDEFLCKEDDGWVNYEDVDFCPSGETTIGSTKTTQISTTPPITHTETTKVSTETTHISTTSPIKHTNTTKGSTETTQMSTTSPVTHTTTETTEVTATEVSPPQFHFVNIICKNVLIESSSDYRYSHTVAVRRGEIIFKFRQKGDQPVYNIQIQGNVSADYVIWINSKDETKYGCNMNVFYETTLGYLEYKETYIVCLLPRNDSRVSPYDCAGLTVPPPWEERAWIPNKSMTLIISAVCGSLLSAIAISSLIMFYCIRQHPKLIKGNKRIIIVESKRADAMVMPKSYDQKINYKPPSLNSYSDGYLTPKNQIYNRIRSRTLDLKTISESSSISDLPPYPYSTPNRIKKSRSRRRAKLDQVPYTFDDHLYELPPVPPNHPCDRKRRTGLTTGMSCGNW